MSRRAQGKAGRPPLPSTVFLVEALPCLPEDVTPSRCPHVYARWRELHRDTMGYELYDPRRSFRAAVVVARRRIRKEGKGKR